MENATHDHLKAVVAAHCAAFPGYFMTLLGPGFLHVFYRHFIESPLGILLVAQDEAGGVLGCLAGTRAPAEFFSTLRKRHAVALVTAALPALLHNPLKVAKRLFSGLWYRGDEPPDLPGYWLLSSLGVREDCAGSGVGTALVTRFVAEAQQTAAAGIYLMTDSDDNDRTKAFYDRRGFLTHSKHVRSDGRRMEVRVRGLR